MPTMSPAQRMSEGRIRPDVPTLPQERGDRLATHAAPSPHGEVTLPRREAASRMGVRLGRLGELP